MVVVLGVGTLTAVVVCWTMFFWLHGHNRGRIKGYAEGVEDGARWRRGHDVD